MKLRILNANEVRQALPMAAAIEGMKQAYAQLSAGQANMPVRSQVAVPGHKGVAIFMPAYLTASDDLAVKVVSVFPENGQRGEPTIYATVLVLDATSGRPLALMEGGALTAIRTGAGAGAATDVLARPEASVVAILGSGVQARTQLEAVCTVRQIRQVRVYSLNRARAEAFAEEMRLRMELAIARPMAGTHGNSRNSWELKSQEEEGFLTDGKEHGLEERGEMSVFSSVREKSLGVAIEVVDSPAAAVRGADIVCAATTSRTPVFDGRDLKPGAHVNAVGSFRPEMQEVDVETVRRALVVVDSRPAVLEEAGDLLVPLAAGEIGEDHIYAELGEILNGDKVGRTSPEQITYFKSVGIAVQDAVAARITLAGAVAAGLGTVVEQ